MWINSDPAGVYGLWTGKFPELLLRPTGSGDDATRGGWRDVAAVAWYFNPAISFPHERMVCAFPLFPTAVPAKCAQQEPAADAADIRRHLLGDLDPDRFHRKSGGNVFGTDSVNRVGLRRR